jgi:RNA polymerase sigma factor (TIGR02999 family)
LELFLVAVQRLDGPVRGVLNQITRSLISERGSGSGVGQGLQWPGMTEVTRILDQIQHGDPQAGEQLLPLVYDELRKLAAQRLAREAPGQTLQATALVHEAYLRLVIPASGGRDPPEEQHWNSRGHFFAAAAEAMRRILIDQARKKKSRKHGGGLERRPLEEVEIASPEPSVDLLAVHEALEKFEQVDKVAAGLVKVRYYAGLTIPQAAEALGISSTTADRHWAYARAWLHAELKKGHEFAD